MKTRAELAITPAAADRWASKLYFDDSVEGHLSDAHIEKLVEHECRCGLMSQGDPWSTSSQGAD
jgi:hypothetical protein